MLIDTRIFLHSTVPSFGNQTRSGLLPEQVIALILTDSYPEESKRVRGDVTLIRIRVQLTLKGSRDAPLFETWICILTTWEDSSGPCSGNRSRSVIDMGNRRLSSCPFREKLIPAFCYG